MAISYNTSTKVITATSTTRLQDVYTDSENVFSGSAYLQYQPPLQANTPTLFTLINGWTFSGPSIVFLTSAALQDLGMNNIWCNVQTLGTISPGTTLYIQQGTTITYTAPTTGHINILLPVKTAGTLISGGMFTVYARLLQQTYSSFSATGGATTANCPLSTQPDINLTIPSATLLTYSDMSITWGAITRDAGDGGGVQPYDILISTTNPARTLQQIYNWVQYQLLLTADIDSAHGNHLGKITDDPILSYAGGKCFTAQGVWVQGFNALDINNIQFIDDNGIVRTPPLAIGITVNVDPSLVASGTAQVAVFKLSTPYVPATYVPSQIASTIINQALTGGVVQASTSLTYMADFPVLVIVRKPGFQSFSQGVTVSTGGLNVTAQNPVDTIYGV